MLGLKGAPPYPAKTSFSFFYENTPRMCTTIMGCANTDGLPLIRNIETRFQKQVEKERGDGEERKA